MKRQLTPIAQVKKINSVAKARAYLGQSQNELGLMMGCDQAIVSKVEHGKMRYNSMQIERLAIAVALKFRTDTRRDDLGLELHYNSPLTFEIRGICYQHGKRGFEYPVNRATDRCPKCKRT